MDDVLQLKPDRLAVYSYAHIPSIMPAQKLLNEDEMPKTDQKLGMLIKTISHFTCKGYRYIGMDHFSREDEELCRAMGTTQCSITSRVRARWPGLIYTDLECRPSPTWGISTSRTVKARRSTTGS
ncbi:MAG: hypothetical protein U5K69_11705 [Balneolaceae bacterium]|nr:hypothetical protein [Balneolaceae bacterium]